MKKHFVALMLLASMGVTSCANTSPTEVTTEITAEVLSETRETEATDSYVEYVEAVLMYAKKDGVIRDTASQTGTEVGTLEVGGEYNVVGEENAFYAISYNDTVCFVERSCLSMNQPPIPTETSESVEESTEETGETEETSETSETDATDATTATPVETTSGGNSGNSGNSSGGGSSAPQQTAAPTETAPVETAPPVETHDMSYWMSQQGISSYTTRDGVTVYGRYVDTSGLDAAVNSYRESLGLPPYAIGDNSACRQTAIDSYSQSAPYWHSGVSNLTTASASGAYDAFYNSPNHRGNWEAAGTSSDPDISYHINMSSASFDFYEYGGDDVGFYYSRSITVQNFETVWEY